MLASAYGFAQADAKTDDHFFLGFPSYWNFVAIYAWLLGVPPTTTAAWLVGLSLLRVRAAQVPLPDAHDAPPSRR